MEVIKIYGVSDCPACLLAQSYAMEAFRKYEYVFINMDFATVYRNNIKKKFVFNREKDILKIRMK